MDHKWENTIIMVINIAIKAKRHRKMKKTKDKIKTVIKMESLNPLVLQ